MITPIKIYHTPKLLNQYWICYIDELAEELLEVFIEEEKKELQECIPDVKPRERKRI